jgi:hypothetical protein
VGSLSSYSETSRLACPKGLSHREVGDFRARNVQSLVKQGRATGFGVGSREVWTAAESFLTCTKCNVGQHAMVR